MTGARLLKMRKHPAHRPLHRGFDDQPASRATAEPSEAQMGSFERDSSSVTAAGGRRKQKN